MATRRRWLRFSIRTMLVVVTLLCVGLSVWVMPLEQQRRAAAAIEAVGGRVTYVASKAPSQSVGTSLLRRWLPQAYFDKVEQVGLTGAQITDAELDCLGVLTGLRQLWLDDTPVTDAGLVRLKGLEDLQCLYLDNTQVTNAGLFHLQNLTGLQMLDLTKTQVTDAGLVYLQWLTELQVLVLDDTLISDAGLIHLQKLTHLKALVLKNARVTYEGLSELRKAIPNCNVIGWPRNGTTYFYIPRGEQPLSRPFSELLRPRISDRNKRQESPFLCPPNPRP